MPVPSLPVLLLAVFGCPSSPTADTGTTAPLDSGTPDSGTPDSGTTPVIDPCPVVLPGGGPPETPLLDLAALSASDTPAGPVDDAAFAVPDGADPPLHVFEGRLELLDEADGQIDNHLVAWWIDPGQESSTLPAFDAAFVQCGNHLVPAQRGRVDTDDLWWDYLLGPGQVWSTAHDQGWTRAALPFSLTMKHENCTQHGSLTFLFNDTDVTDVRWQITQETCHVHQFDMWGQSGAVWHPEPVPDAADIRTAFAAELDQRLPLKPWTELATDHPGLDPAQLDRGYTLADLSARGLVIDRTLYLDRCRTRFGDYAFCESTHLASFSLAKTAFTGLGMMALAQDYGAGVFDRTLTDLLPDAVAQAEESWEGVTLEHLLDMTTGHYRTTGQADDAMGTFYTAWDLESRLQAALLFPYQEPPGESVVYLTPNNQLLSAAMGVVLSQEGATRTDAYDWVVERVYTPAGLPPELGTSLRTSVDGGENNGTAFGGYGMTFTPQGAALLGQFLLDGALVDGVPVLDPEALADGLFRNPDDRGLDMDYNGWSYNSGFWGYPADPDCDAWVPFFFGVSGITLGLYPNGITYFAFNDVQQYPIYGITEQLDGVSPLCP